MSFSRTTIHIIPTSEVDMPIATIPSENEDAPGAPVWLTTVILGVAALALRRFAQTKP